MINVPSYLRHVYTNWKKGTQQAKRIDSLNTYYLTRYQYQGKSKKNYIIKYQGYGSHIRVHIIWSQCPKKNQTPNVFKISKFDSQTHLLPHSLCKKKIGRKE